MTKKELAFAYAVDHHQKMDITYVNGHNERKKRRILPTTMSQSKHDGRWMCTAWCEASKGIRSFKMNRVDIYHVLREYFTAEEIARLQRVFAKGK